MAEIKLVIPGRPIAKKRPRFARKGRYVVTYSDQQTEEGRFLLELYRQYRGKPLDGGIILSVAFIMPIPKGTSSKKSIQMAEGKIDHTKKPDLDNMLKFVLDCCNNVLWQDDSQIYQITALKKYGTPQTEISVITREE